MRPWIRSLFARSVQARCHRRRSKVQLEQLEWRCLLAVTFLPETPILVGDSTYPKSIFAADFDQDNDMDIVVASLVNNRVAWYENLDGQGTYGEQRVISDTAIQAATVYAADLDGDGDMDVISGGAGRYDSDVSWYENDGQGNFGEPQVISAEVQGTDSVFAADVDNDGDLDVLSASRGDSKVAWYENLDSKGSFGDQQIITDTADGATSVFAADLDDDGDLDVVAGAYRDDSIRWFENEGNGDFSDEILLTDTASANTAVSVADLDADGDLDIIFTSRDDNTLGWFPNLGVDEEGLQFGPERIISLDDGGPNELFIADLDGDGLLDIAVAGRRANLITWHKNLGGGMFDGPRVISNNAGDASAVFAVDVDSDGDMDLFSTSRSDDKVAFYRNTDGLGAFEQEQVLSRIGSLGAQFVSTADVDGDGDPDAVFAAYDSDSVSWAENLDGRGTFGPERLIGDHHNGAEAVLMVDLDNDGDLDAVAASIRDDKIAWFENLDSKGNFGPQRLISGDANGPEYLAVGDIDNDGDMDVLSASRGDFKVAWYENIDGAGTFGPQIIVSGGQTVPATFVEVADLDGDGDLDIISNGYSGSETNFLAWYENVDGDGTFGPANFITQDVALPTSVDIADIDDDGDLDLVATSGGDDRVVWYENTDSEGKFGEGRLISDTTDGAFSVKAADFDGDGDVDVVVAALLGDTVAWFENEDGRGDFGDEQLITTDVQSASSIYVDDLDGDGLPDILLTDSTKNEVAWFRNVNDANEGRGDFNDDGEVDVEDVDLLCGEILGDGLNDDFDLTGDGAVNSSDMNELIVNILRTSFGDANLDGIFNSADFVTVFAAGEYEDAIDGNSTWADGDWNCDGDFATGDLVFALQSGGYVSGATPQADWWAIAAALQQDERDEQDERDGQDEQTGRRGLLRSRPQV